MITTNRQQGSTEPVEICTQISVKLHKKMLDYLEENESYDQDQIVTEALKMFFLRKCQESAKAALDSLFGGNQ